MFAFAAKPVLIEPEKAVPMGQPPVPPLTRKPAQGRASRFAPVDEILNEIAQNERLQTA